MTLQRFVLPALLSGLLALCGCNDQSKELTTETKAAAHALPEQELPAPLFDNLGDQTHPISSTDNPLVQRYFDQGMILTYGFNHQEAIRSFKAAQSLDPQCAICYWGEALAWGPNINVSSDGKAIMSLAAQTAATRSCKWPLPCRTVHRPRSGVTFMR